MMWCWQWWCDDDDYNNVYYKDAYCDDDSNDNVDYHDNDGDNYDNNIIIYIEAWASGAGFKIFDCGFLKASNRKVS